MSLQTIAFGADIVSAVVGVLSFGLLLFKG
jgi:hypothetical protein